MASAGFSSQKNLFNFAEGKAHCVASSTGYSTKTAEVTNEHGDVIAKDVYGKAEAPSCEYKLAQALEGADFPALGRVIPVDPGSGLLLPLMLTAVEISTGAGAEVGITLSGVGVEPGAPTLRTFPLDSIGAVSPLHMAQILGSAAQVSSGNVTTSTLTAEADHAVDEVTGEPIASDIWNGRMTVSLEIVSSTGVKPTVTPGQGWLITGALSPKDEDGGYQTWTCVLSKELAPTEPLGA